MLEENDYDDNQDLDDPSIALRHQKYKTRLYVGLLIGQSLVYSDRIQENIKIK